MVFERTPKSEKDKYDRAATPQEIGFGMGEWWKADLDSLNRRLARRFEEVKEAYDAENAALDAAGEVFRLEHLLGKNPDANILERAAGYFSGTKEDKQKLEKARKDHAFLKAKAQILKAQLAEKEKLEKEELDKKRPVNRRSN